MLFICIEASLKVLLQLKSVYINCVQGLGIMHYLGVKHSIIFVDNYHTLGLVSKGPWYNTSILHFSVPYNNVLLPESEMIN